MKGKGFLQIGKKGKNTRFVARRVDKWIFLPSDHLVLQKFNAVTRSIANYYSGSCYPTPLIDIYHLLRRSAALTLAHRHKKRTAKWSFEKWGKELTIETTITKKGKEQTKITRFFLPHKENYTTLSKWKVGKDKSGHLEELMNTLTAKGTYLPTTLSAVVSAKEDMCSIPNCPNQAEAWHHIKHRKKYKGMKKTDVTRLALYSKQIPVCKKHHDQIHNGKYGGPSLRKLPGYML